MNMTSLRQMLGLVNEREDLTEPVIAREWTISDEHGISTYWDVKMPDGKNMRNLLVRYRSYSPDWSLV